MINITLLNKNHVKVDFAYNPKIVEALQLLPSAQYVDTKKNGKYWKVLLLDLNLLRDALSNMMSDGTKVFVDQKVKDAHSELSERNKNTRDLAAKSESDFVPVGMKKGVELYEFQKVAANFLVNVEKGLVALDMGLGKFQDVDSKLLTIDGFIRMGDVKIGDEVFGSDGLPHKVTAIFPQGPRDCYEIEFTDGSRTTSGDEHLWNIQSPCQKLRRTGYITKRLQEFKNDLHDKNGNTKWFIPMIDALSFPKKNLPLDPYAVGALIGDGSLGTRHSVVITSADTFILDELSRLLPPEVELSHNSKCDYRIRRKANVKINPINRIIKSLNLNVKSYDKHIPDNYKFSSIDQRISMLQGLMDTDGGVDSKDGIVITYSSTSEQLTNDVQFIVESLGGTAKKKTRITKFTYKGIKKDGRRSWRLNISLPPEIKPFRLPRKLMAYRPRSKYKPYRGIKSVIYTGTKECQCITVNSSDHLYVTDHCILTHNTVTSIAATMHLIKDKKVKKVLVICPASLKYNWAFELAKFTDCTYLVVEGDAKKRVNQYKSNYTFIIMNYDLLRTDIDHVADIEWDLIIADEIQRAKNYNTATSKKIRTLDAPYIFALTGTPIENDVMDLFTIMKFINQGIFGSNPKRFKDRYCEQNYFGGVTGYKNLDEIKKKLSNIMIRRKKRDVLDELPDKVVEYYYVNLNEEEKKLYKQIKSGLIENFNGGKLKHVDALAQVVYLREICDCVNLVQPGEKIISSKLEELKRIISDIPPESKVVIFTAFERMSRLIESQLPYKSVRLHGGVENNCILENEIEKDIKKNFKHLKPSELEIKMHEEKKKAICQTCPYYNDDSKCYSRKKITNKFNNEKDIKLFISTDAGKEGLNLQSADTFVNYDMSFNPAVNEQRIARIDRIGQKADKILIVNMVCYDTIEVRMLDILQKKQKIFDMVVDGSDNDLLKKMSTDKIIEII